MRQAPALRLAGLKNGIPVTTKGAIFLLPVTRPPCRVRRVVALSLPDGQSGGALSGRVVPEGLLSRESDEESPERPKVAGLRRVSEGLLSREDDTVSESAELAASQLRSVPEGWLSRDDGDNGGTPKVASLRPVPEGMLSREDDVASKSNPVGAPVLRVVPEGVLSRDDDSGSGFRSQTAVSGLRSVPEGFLSREDDDSSGSTGISVRQVPEGTLSREDDSSSQPNVPTAASGLRIVPEGLLSHEDDGSLSSSAVPSVRQVPEGMLSREGDSDGEAPNTTNTGAVASGSPGSPALPDCVLSREEYDDGPYDDGPYPVGLRVLPEGMLSREDDDGDGDGGAAGGGGGAPPTPLRRPVIAAASVVTVPPATFADGAAADGSAPQAEAGAEAAPESSQFNWFQQWYVVAPLDCLDPTRPHPFTLLGQELVLWRDGSGRWRAFQDACPHRLAPLSEGRIESDGTLLCAYHGWRFDGSGACTSIPTCGDAAQEKRATSNPRSCAVPYPTLERGGLLWVWGEGGPGAEARSAAKSPALPPEVQEDGRAKAGVAGRGWTFRDLPYGHVYFIENVVDPAHVPVSHHNIAGDRYKDTKPFAMELTRAPSRDGGFEVRIDDSWKADVRDSTTAFAPPGHVRIQQNHHHGGRTVLALYSTPTRPGWTRHTGQQFLVEAPGGGSRGSGLGFFAAPLPDWVMHALSALFLHQDMVFLHHQERTVAQQLQQQQQREAGAAGAAASDAVGPKYFMPTSVDRGVIAWRKWLSTYAGGDVTYAPGTPPLSPRERDPSQLFDTWNTHTRQCAICMRALARMRVVRMVAAVVGVAAAALAVATAAARAAAAAAGAAAAAAAGAGVSAPALSVLAAAGLGFLCVEVAALCCVAGLAGLVHWGACKLEGVMHKYEYSHADNH